MIRVIGVKNCEKDKNVLDQFSIKQSPRNTMEIHPSSPNSKFARENKASGPGLRVSPNRASEMKNCDLERVEEEAIKIQAQIRGFLVRKRLQKFNDAATKIQTSFRGFVVRKTTPKN